MRNIELKRVLVWHIVTSAMNLSVIKRMVMLCAGFKQDIKRLLVNNLYLIIHL